MTANLSLFVLVALGSVLVGVTLGWYLRRVNVWCPRCGGSLSCRSCGQRPTANWHRSYQRSNQRWDR